MVGTFVAFLPAIVAIILALITKEVYLSLFIGIFVGALFLSKGDPIGAVQHTFEIMAEQLGNNGGILIFLVVLGIFSVLMVKSGGSNAYSNWACGKIKTKRGALLMGIALGGVSAIDDYFDCMTLGSVMRPITDKHGISHSKLSYLIHSTAASFCIIAPISSWSASIAGYLDGGIIAFFKTIPLNMYAILAIGVMLSTSFLGYDLFKMKKDEKLARETGDLDAGETDIPVDTISVMPNPKGKVIHLIIPIASLFICCIGCMLYSGWTAIKADPELTYNNFFDLFANCDSSIALATGSAIALFITAIFYMATKVISFTDAMNSVTQGFTSMVPAMLILVFAWTISAIMGAKGAGIDEMGNVIVDGTLNAKAFVMRNISADSLGLGAIPFVFFVAAAVIAFATGTSWGTFGVLIPIASTVITVEEGGLYYLSMSAILAGAVFGDNTSPISDTTILSSSAAHCNHLSHVKSQLPYASIAAVSAGITYLITGLITQSGIGTSYGLTVLITLCTGIPLFAIGITILYYIDKFGIASKINKKIVTRLNKHE